MLARENDAAQATIFDERLAEILKTEICLKLFGPTPSRDLVITDAVFLKPRKRNILHATLLSNVAPLSLAT